MRHDYAFFGRRWLRIRSEDPFGNEITYEISNLKSERRRVERIDYNFVGRDARASIDLRYEERPDLLRGWDIGYKTTTAFRLDAIDVTWKSGLVRVYRFVYDDQLGQGSSTGRSRLAYVELCAGQLTDGAGNPQGAPSKCLPPTRFRYQEGDPGFRGPRDVELPAPHKDYAHAAAALDINRDASDDIAFVTDVDGKAFWAFAVADNTKDSGFGPVHQSDIAPGEARFVQILDINNDRRDDIVYLHDATKFEVLVGLELGLTQDAQPGETIEFLAAIDFDGDGFREVMTCEGPDENSLRWVWYQTSGELEMERVVLEHACPVGAKLALDVDHDGATDLIDLGYRLECEESEKQWLNEFDDYVCEAQDKQAPFEEACRAQYGCDKRPCFTEVGLSYAGETFEYCKPPPPTPGCPCTQEEIDTGSCVGNCPDEQCTTEYEFCVLRVEGGNGYRLSTSQVKGKVGVDPYARFESNGDTFGGYIKQSLGTVDLNGDGILDPIFLKTTGSGTVTVRVSIGTGESDMVPRADDDPYDHGSGFIETSIPLATLGSEPGLMRYIDWDSDGTTDLLVADGTWKVVQMSLDADYVNLTATTIDTGIDVVGQVMVGDYDGDGLTDLLTNDGLGLSENGNPVPTTDRWTLYRHHHPSFRTIGARGLPDLLREVENGVGQLTSIDYRPLTDELEWAETCDYPQRCDSSPRPVVHSHVIADHAETTYSYAGPRFDMLGRQDLGFEKVTTVQSRGPTYDPITTWVEFDNSTFDTDRNGYVGAGQPTRRTTWVAAGAFTGWHRVYQTTNQYVVNDTASLDVAHAPTTYIRYASQTIERMYELKSAIDGPEITNATPLTETISTATLDDYANVITSFQQLSPNDVTGTTTTYDYDLENWLIARPDVHTVVSSSNGDTVSRTLDYDWSGATLDRIVRSPGDAAHELTTLLFYNEHGLLRVRTVNGGIDGSVTESFEYDTVAGVYLVSARNALGQTNTQEWDYGQGVVVRTADEAAVGWVYGLDEFGRVVSGDRVLFGEFGATDYALSGEGFTTEYERLDPPLPKTSSRLRVRHQRHGGGERTQEFDVHGRLEREGWTLSDEASYQRYTYDDLGRLASISQPTWASDNPSGWTEFQRDNHDRVRFVHGPLGSVHENQYHALVLTTTDAEGRKRRKTHDLLGRLVESIEGYGSAEASSVCYRYAAFGKPAAVIRGCDENADTTTYTSYDTWGKKTSLIDPALGTWGFEYDGFDRLFRTTDGNGARTRYSYDALGRQTQRYELDSGAVHSWTWDEDYPGALYEASVAGGPTIRTERDSFGRLRHTTTIDGATTLLETIDYDGHGRPSVVTMPAQQGLPPFRLLVGYSALGQVAGLSNADSGELYWELTGVDVAGRITDEAFGNGLATHRSFDELGRPTSIQTAAPGDIGALASGPVGVFWETYGWDLSSNLTARTDNVLGGTEGFDYDDVGRLRHITATSNGLTNESWAGFDLFGNFTSKTGVGTYDTSPSGRVHSVEDRAFQHDSNGNVIRVDPLSAGDGFVDGQPTLPIEIDWNARNKPTRITTPDGDTTIVRDANDVIVRREEPGRTVVRAGAYERVTAAQTVSDHYRIVGPHGLVAQVTRQKDFGLATGEGDPPAAVVVETVEWVHSDHLGSARARTDNNGDVVQRMSFDGWGTPRSPGDWFAGTVDSSTGAIDVAYGGHRRGGPFVDMGGRQFDPVTGTMLSADPIVPNPQSNQSLNRYMYAFGNPTSMTDPSGHVPVGWRDAGIDGGGILLGGSSALAWGMSSFATGRPGPVFRALGDLGRAINNWLDNRGGNNESRSTSSAAVPSQMSISGGTGVHAPAYTPRRQGIQFAFGPDCPACHPGSAGMELSTLNEAFAQIQGAEAAVSAFFRVMTTFDEVDFAEWGTAMTVAVADSPAPGPGDVIGAGIVIGNRGKRLGRALNAAERAFGAVRKAVNANSYLSSKRQYLYAIYDKAGELVKYGTTSKLGRRPERIWNGRYSRRKFLELAGEGGTMEILKEGYVREIRDAERRLILMHKFIWGVRPPKNFADH